MRFVVNSSLFALLLLSIGCAPSLERRSYPVSDLNIVSYGIIVDYQPYKATSSETKGSRAAWGLLGGGLIGAAISANADDEVGFISATEYLVKTKEHLQGKIPSYSKIKVGECVAVFGAVDDVFHYLERVDPAKCQ